MNHERGAQLIARVTTGVCALGRGVVLSALMAAGFALMAVLLLTVAGIVTGFGFAVVGPPWEPSVMRFAVTALMVLAPFAIIPLLATVVLSPIRNLANLTRRLCGQWCGVAIPEPYRPRPAGHGIRRRLAWQLTDPATWRDLLWVVANGFMGWTLVTVPSVLAAVGAVGVLGNTGGPFQAVSGDIQRLVLSVLFLAAGVFSAPPLLRAYGLFARALLAPSDHAELARRVQHLSQTRTETIDTGAAEIRRIERDLHDGAQARLVAMGMTLDAAGQLIDDNPKAARALLIEARDNSAKALADLRNLVRGIHPPVLADRGLAEAIKALALDSPLRTYLASDLNGRLPAPVESAAYFAINELLANVSKHADAGQVWVDIRFAGGMLKIGVTDDGRGGASMELGTGLRGIERRLAAFDGVLAVSSPPGGPTAVTMEIPCVLSSPKTSSY